MRGGEPPADDDTADDDPFFDLFGVEWRTGTSLDHYTPVYRMLRQRGISQHDADRMDISQVALELGIGMTAAPDAAPGDAPVLDAAGRHAPATAPPGVKPPSWWRGDKAAFRSSMRAGRQLSGAPETMA